MSNRPALLAALVPLLLASGPVEGAPSAWKAVSASGRVEARSPGAQEQPWQRVARGDRLEARAAVRTGRRGRTTLVHGASILTVDPASEVELPHSSPGDAGRTVVQNRGSVVYEVDGRRDGPLRVITPHLVAGVKGTVFLVTVREDEASVTVREGVVDVLVRERDETIEVEAGESLSVDLADEASIRLMAMDAPDPEARKVARGDQRRLARVLDRGGLDTARDGAADPLGGDGGSHDHGDDDSEDAGDDESEDDFDDELDDLLDDEEDADEIADELTEDLIDEDRLDDDEQQEEEEDRQDPGDPDFDPADPDGSPEPPGAA